MKIYVFGAVAIALVLIGVLISEQGPAHNIDLRILEGVAAPMRAVPVQFSEALVEPTACAMTPNFERTLKEIFGQLPVVTWQINRHSKQTLFGRPDGLTWTLALSDSKGVSCVITAGRIWRPFLQPSEIGQGS